MKIQENDNWTHATRPNLSSCAGVNAFKTRIQVLTGCGGVVGLPRFQLRLLEPQGKI